MTASVFHHLEIQRGKVSMEQQHITASSLHHVGRTTSFTTERERNNYFYPEDSPQVGETQSNTTMSSGMARFNPNNKNNTLLIMEMKD
jgi:hypothetical protein